MPTIAQIRAARALLDWSQADLADHAGLSQTGIARIENGTNKPNSGTLDKINNAFDTSFVEFINGGVRLSQDKLKIIEGEACLRKLQDDIFHTLQNKKGAEVLLLGISEIKPEETEDYEYTQKHIERLIKANISERIIVSANEHSFLGPKEWYRRVPEDFFSAHTVFVYDTKVALAIRDPMHKVLLLDNQFFAETMKTFFNFVWNNAEDI